MRGKKGLLTKNVNKINVVSTHIRVPSFLRDILKQKSKSNDMSIAKYIKYLVKKDGSV